MTITTDAVGQSPKTKTTALTDDPPAPLRSPCTEFTNFGAQLL